MRTQIIPEQARGTGWLEHFPDDGGPPQRTALDQSPFVVGRSASADLPLNSTRVSREHAVFVRDAAGYRVRDLDSTNGTFLNGRRIQEGTLCDGDVLVVANVEFTFHSGRTEGPRNAATQVMNFEDDEDDAGAEAETDLLRNLRRLHETLVSGCQPCCFDPVVELDGDRLFGYVPLPDVRLCGTDDALAGPVAGSRTARRLRRVQRMRALEQAARLAHDTRVFMYVDAAELAEAELADSLADLRSLVDDPARLVVALPCHTATAASQAEVVAGQLRQVGVAVALTGFTGRPGQTLPPPEGSPDYVILSDAIVRRLPGSVERQTLVQTLVGNGRERGWTVVAAGIRTAEERQWCQELGCVLGHGPWFQRPHESPEAGGALKVLEAAGHAQDREPRNVD